MKQTYLIRLDDACPTMNQLKWSRIEGILDKYNIKPLIGIIPANEDSSQKIDDPNANFWDMVKNWKDKGWELALHGFSHMYEYSDSGLMPFWRKSEFAGAPLEIQRDKIRKGLDVLSQHGIHPRIFFAPSHTFDFNTLNALKTESDIRIISDGISYTMYKENGFIFVPQICGRCVFFPYNGIFTFCFHPNVMTDKDFNNLESFLKFHNGSFASFDSLDYASTPKRNWIMKLMHYAYFKIRKFRNLY